MRIDQAEDRVEDQYPIRCRFRRRSEAQDQHVPAWPLRETPARGARQCVVPTVVIVACLVSAEVISVAEVRGGGSRRSRAPRWARGRVRGYDDVSAPATNVAVAFDRAR